ncbi:nitroreductase/quinone reductase family protein [Krasilnikovia sp. MM14-A1004]|uniref:nitroreductase/quinone reductase family protein n=1 Tax=Krasilnikovia sp. MM14-A1004 TaxID=3373541 RepID=UPI00399C8130
MIRTLTRRMGRQRWFATAFRLLVPTDRLVGRLTRGRVLSLGLVPSLLITTTGRRSGQPRSNPLLYVRDGDAWVVVGSNWGQTHQPAWVHNLTADPNATVTVGGAEHAVRARRVDGAERDRLWALLVAEWPAFPVYAERAGDRPIEMFRLEPVS